MGREMMRRKKKTRIFIRHTPCVYSSHSKMKSIQTSDPPKKIPSLIHPHLTSLSLSLLCKSTKSIHAPYSLFSLQRAPTLLIDIRSLLNCY